MPLGPALVLTLLTEDKCGSRNFSEFGHRRVQTGRLAEMSSTFTQIAESFWNKILNSYLHPEKELYFLKFTLFLFSQ